MGDEAAQRVGLAHCLCPQGTWSGEAQGGNEPQTNPPCWQNSSHSQVPNGMASSHLYEILESVHFWNGLFFPLVLPVPPEDICVTE